MGEWEAMAQGATLGEPGPQGALITRDESNPRGARLTVEEDAERGLYAITASIPDWLVHARFLPSSEAAHAAVEQMRRPLEELAGGLPERRFPPGDERAREAGARLAQFTTRFA